MARGEREGEGVENVIEGRILKGGEKGQALDECHPRVPP
jgi:hypothetical protein